MCMVRCLQGGRGGEEDDDVLYDPLQKKTSNRWSPNRIKTYSALYMNPTKDQVRLMVCSTQQSSAWCKGLEVCCHSDGTLEQRHAHTPIIADLQIHLLFQHSLHFSHSG